MEPGKGWLEKARKRERSQRGTWTVLNELSE
jgi:hypothetical protein